MRSVRTLLVVVFCGTAAAIDPATVEGMLSPLWTQSDTDGDGKLSLTEFTGAAGTLGIKASIFVNHGSSLTNVFNALETSGDGLLTQAELAAALNTMPEYREPLMAAFTNNAGVMPEIDDVTPSAEVLDADASVTVQLTLEGTEPSEIYAGQRDQIRTYFADVAGVETSAVLITFLPVGEARRVLRTVDELRRARRQLQGGSTAVTATIFVEDASKTDAIVADLAASDPASAPAFAGMSVLPMEVEPSVLVPALPITNLAIVAAVLVFAGIFLCCNASFWSGRRARKARAAGTATTVSGCCTTGCCSFNAVKPWSFGELTAAIAILGTVAYLYINVNELVAAILGILDTFLAVVDLKTDITQQITAQIPDAAMDQLRAQRGNLDLAPLGVLVPGGAAAIFLLLASVLPSAPGHKGSYCCSKACVILADLLLIVSFITYVIFAAFSVIVRNVPDVSAQVAAVRGYCEVIPMTVMQLVSDNQLALEAYEKASPGMSFTDEKKTLEDLEAVGVLLDQGCDYVNSMIYELIDLFFPGVLCIVAIVFAMFVNQTLCCAMGCCRGPPKDSTTVTPKGGKEEPDMLQNI